MGVWGAGEFSGEGKTVMAVKSEIRNLEVSVMQLPCPGRRKRSIQMRSLDRSLPLEEDEIKMLGLDRSLPLKVASVDGVTDRFFFPGPHQ